MGISSPLVYSGGIRNLEDAIEILKLGTDRICIDNLSQTNLEECKKISRVIGAQAVILALPLSIQNGSLMHLNYITKKEQNHSLLLEKSVISDWASEFLIIDWKNEGKEASFDFRLIEKIPFNQNKLIAFGGITTTSQVNQLLNIQNISAIAIGNSLNFSEHAVQKIKKSLRRLDIRNIKF